MTALICGTPTPAITRVVQIEPAPIPTLTALTPQETNSRAASFVTIFPAISCKLLYFFRISLTVFNTPSECPCAVSRTTTSTLEWIRASTLFNVSFVTPTPAPTRSRPKSSLHALGNVFFFIMSL